MKRPTGVTVVAVLAWLSGALSIIRGIIALVEGAGWLGAVDLVLGVIIVVISVGVLRGNGVARIVLAILWVLHLVSALVALFSPIGSIWISLAAAAVAVVALILLFSPKANRFFAHART